MVLMIFTVDSEYAHGMRGNGRFRKIAFYCNEALSRCGSDASSSVW